MKKTIMVLHIGILFQFPKTWAFPPEVVGVYFPPEDNAPGPIIRLYDSAQKYIHLAIYSLTRDEFAEALIRAHGRGVEVKVIIDKTQAGNQHADDEWLENTGIELRRDTAGGLSSCLTLRPLTLPTGPLSWALIGSPFVKMRCRTAIKSPS